MKRLYVYIHIGMVGLAPSDIGCFSKSTSLPLGINKYVYVCSMNMMYIHSLFFVREPF